jgi:hypothetical protein
MDHIDLSGWQAPDGKGVDDCVRIVRGTPEMIERLVVEVPSGRGFCLGDITINGNPIHFGGQIAECITVKLVGVGHILPKPVKTTPSNPRSRGYIDAFQPSIVSLTRSFKQAVPPGNVEAFQGQGTAEMLTNMTKPLTQKLARAAGSKGSRKRLMFSRR